MACNCCKPGGCSCKMRTSDANAEEPTFAIYPFSYNFNYKMYPWINRDYPEPMFMATWDSKTGSYLASNHVKINGQLRYYGGLSTYSRKGLPAYGANGGYYVEDGNGDESGPYTDPPSNVIARALTVFVLEEKQDAVKRECQLWAKFKRLTPIFDANGNYTGLLDGPYGELELLHSMSWDEPFQAQLIIEISGDHFNGPTSVELKYQCADACIVFNNTNGGSSPFWTWEVTGQADWVTESTIEFPLDYCKSYGSYDGTVSFTYKNCNPLGGLVDNTTNNRSKKIHVATYSSCGYNYGFSLTFLGYGGGLCQEVPLPCNPGPNNPNYYCCGNVFGGYVMQPDGTESCGYMSQITPFSSYSDDIYNRDLIDSKTVRFNGTFMNAVTKYTQSYDCATGTSQTDPTYEYKPGTILATGV